ncbi:MAG: integrase/recombinase XerD [Oceanospirillaceae bacterium]|jgi:integrase/recombinase XerD
MDKRVKILNVELPDQQLIMQFVEYLDFFKKITHNSKLAYQRDLRSFQHWLSDSDLHLLDANNAIVTQYLLWRISEGVKLSTNARSVSCLKSFYKYQLLLRNIKQDPCFGLTLPKHIPLTMPVLTNSEVEQLLAAPDIETPLGARDNAMISLLYATGVKVSELIGIRCSDLDLANALLTIKEDRTKDAKQRTVPITKETCVCLQRYLNDSRKAFLKEANSEWLFLNRRGQRLSRQAFWYRMQYYTKQLSFLHNVSPQLLRRAFAVHLLENGVDLQQMRKILGHSALSSTQIYSQISSYRLQSVRN